MAKKDKDETGKYIDPEAAAKRGSRPGAKDAHCTECGEWYDSNNNAQRNKHAH